MKFCYTKTMQVRQSRAWRVSGRVQGVGFRYFVLDQARSLGLVGWVANRRDGTVEVHAAGTASALDVLETALKEGPPQSNVSAVTSVPPSAGLEGRGSFGIEFTWA